MNAKELRAAAERIRTIPEHKRKDYDYLDGCRGSGSHLDDLELLANAYLATVHADDPELDGTDGAHPAYWRGTDAGFASICQQVSELLDGKPATGVCAEPWNSLRHKISAMVQAHADDDEPVTVEFVRTIARTCCNGLYVIEDATKPFHVGIEIDEEGVGLWVRDNMHPGDPQFNTWLSTDIKARGQLRRLLAGLGMETTRKENHELSQ